MYTKQNNRFSPVVELGFSTKQKIVSYNLVLHDIVYHLITFLDLFTAIVYKPLFSTLTDEQI